MMIILAPLPFYTLAASRGTGTANLASADPKEVWQDSAAGTATLDIDLGAVRQVDTIALIAVQPAAMATNWTITGGASGYTQVTIKAAGALRAVDSAGEAPSRTHALWHGTAVLVRYIRVSVTQPAGYTPLSIGSIVAGAAFTPRYPRQWGAGRKIIDTGTATALPSGGFGVVEGVRKSRYSWTFGDLDQAEVDRLYAIQRDRGETRPVLVVEDVSASTGQLNRIHYAKFVELQAYERRNVVQTRWEMTIEEWA